MKSVCSDHTGIELEIYKQKVSKKNLQIIQNETTKNEKTTNKIRKYFKQKLKAKGQNL